MAAAELICRLMHARTAAHLAHLKTRSFAQHKALDEFYTDLVDLIDSFAEVYQGLFGLIENYPNCPMPEGDPVQWLDELRQWMKKWRAASCEGESALENIHDEIVALIGKTLYQLKYLDSGTVSAPRPAAEPPAESSMTSESGEDYLKMSKWM